MKGIISQKDEKNYTYMKKIFSAIQHNLAHVEIVTIDSSLLLLISKEDSIIDDFRNDFPLAEDLEEFNSKLK